MGEILEPEEKKDYQEADYNPLDEAVNVKSYSAASINTEGVDFTQPIPEPKFTPPPVMKKEEPKAQPKPPPPPVNPNMQELPKKEKKQAAQQMAKMILQGYEWVHEIGNKALQVSEKKLAKLQADGELNLNAMIDYDYGRRMPAGEFFREYNQQVSNILVVSDEFKEEVTPVLEQVLADRGVGMTPEQYLMYLFAKDLAAKGFIFFQQKAQLSFMIESIKQATTSQYAPTPPPQTQQQQQATPPPAAASTTAPEKKQEANVQEAIVTDSTTGTNAIKPDVIVLNKKKGGRPRKPI